jgi:hypothetical protein
LSIRNFLNFSEKFLKLRVRNDILGIIKNKYPQRANEERDKIAIFRAPGLSPERIAQAIRPQQNYHFTETQME